MRTVFYIVSLSFLQIALGQAVINCNGEATLANTVDTHTINYPHAGATIQQPSTCTYIVRSHPGTFITATITHNIAGTEPSCTTQRIWVARDGSPSFTGGSFYCGVRQTTPLTISSIGNEISIAFQSSTVSGTMRVTLRAVALTSTNCDCSWNPSTKIINGVNASPNEFVGFAAFVTTNQAFNEVVCGGSIISQHWVLTAAHCIFAIKNDHGFKVRIAVGRQNITAPESSDTPYAASYAISHAVVHAQYNSSTNQNDIALVRSGTYIRYSRGVGPMCLAFGYVGFPVPTNTILTAIGFGSTEYALSVNYDKTSWILQKVQLTVNNALGVCPTDKTRLCLSGTFNPNTGLTGDTCQRDSGGPIMGIINGRNQQLGLTSEGIACGARNSFSTNTYVPSFISWIQGVIGTGEFLCRK